MKKIVEIKLDNNEFQKVKKRKQSIIIQKNYDELGNLKKKDKIKIINIDKDKFVYKKVKTITKYIDTEDLLKNTNKKKLGYQKKENMDSKDLTSKYGNSELISIELITSKKIIRKVFLGIFVILLLLFIIHKVRYFMDNLNMNKIKKYKEEEVITAIVSINPSIALKIKNDTVIDALCLNDDCKDLLTKMNYNYNDDINNKNINIVIEDFYNGAKNNGYDVSNGITLSSSSNVEILINDIKNIKYEYITSSEIEDIITKEEPSFNQTEISKTEYNQKLLSMYEKDSDYNKTFSCGIYDEEVKCYMTDFKKEVMKNFGNENFIINTEKLIENEFAFRRLLDKFNIQYELSGLAISTIELADFKSYPFVNKSDICLLNAKDENGTVVGCAEKLTLYDVITIYENQDFSQPEIYISSKLLSFDKINLVTKTFEDDDITVIEENSAIERSNCYGYCPK